MPTRRTVLKSLAGMTAAGLFLPAYAFGIAPGFRLSVADYAPKLPNWPADLDLTIAAIADVHVGEPHMSAARVEAIVEATNALESDLVVLLGDYVAGHHWVTRNVPIADCARALAGLKAPLGTVAIVGNHDWWDDLAAQRTGQGPILAARTLMDAGIPVLENDAMRLVKGNRAFWVCGLGDMRALIRPRGRPRGVHDLPKTLAGLTDDAPAILLTHEPDIFPDVPDRISLTLAGHTHGGQVRLFGWSPVVPSIYGSRYAYGHVVENERHLIVSGGLGTSILPVRFGVPPEIVMVRLGGENAAYVEGIPDDMAVVGAS